MSGSDKDEAPNIDVKVAAENFDVAALHQLPTGHSETGAVASFIGKVRQQESRQENSEQGASQESLAALEIEHYPAMTERSIVEICEQAASRWSLLHCVVRHRVGRLRVGENIVAVVISASHREGAFRACEYIMDFLKTDAPFWKKAIYDDGEEWITAKSSDDAKRESWV